MSVAARYIQSPTAVLDYLIDWAQWLASPPAAPGDTITSHTFTPDTGITVVDLGINNAATGVTLRVSGGTIGVTYNIVSAITTAGGRTDERTFAFLIREL